MTPRYNHDQVREYWQRAWDRADVYACPDDAEDPTYVLGMFPYTSGALHMGHVRNYAITDALARYGRMSGEAVLHPMGWDAFGLPAENAAYDRDTDPESWTRRCIERMREELEELGFGYDWSREITTCDPAYYRWNQWLFARLHEAGLVEYTAAPVNWCPDCETVLADAQVEAVAATDAGGDPASGGSDAGGGTTDDGPGQSRRDARAEGHAAAHEASGGVCWRCETPVERRDLDQWFFTITDYAAELEESLADLTGWPEGVRESQRNWIGRQEGVRITFERPAGPDVAVFSTRPDTVFGATYLALAPGHDLATELARTDPRVAEYVERARSGRGAVDPQSGVETDATVHNPVTGDELPVYVADYALEDVGTGAVMGVPAHDERDHAFAREHGLPVRQVLEPAGDASAGLPEEPFTDTGRLATDDEYDGLASAEVAARLRDHPRIEQSETYRLRDWLISRQRYWGTPIPVVHCPDCGPVLVPDEDLPVELPEYVQTTGNPLAANEAFVETECPDCGGPAERETDTMDTFVDSSWYFLRYLSPDLETAPFDRERADEWLPVDVYVGGEEHAVLHLLYIRFFSRALADAGLLDRREPVERLINQGTVLHGGEKMSKSEGNAVAPHEYGAETTRLFVLSAAHPEQDFEWTEGDVGRVYDFQQDVYRMVVEFDESDGGRTERADHDAYLERAIDRTIAAVTDEYERVRFHRVVSELETFAALLGRYRAYAEPYRYAYSRGLRTLAALVAPLAPYLAEELWSRLSAEGLVAEADWPTPLQDVSEYGLERALVRTTLADVRDIADVTDTDPDRVEVVVAPDWKYRVYALAREGEDGSTLVERVRGDPQVPAPDETVLSYAGRLAGQSPGLEPVLPAQRELSVLSDAAWLFADEFDAAVEVRRAAEAGDLGADARPGKPAIHLS